MRLVQLRSGTGTRRIAIVDDDKLRFAEDTETAFDLAWKAIHAGEKIESAVRLSDETADYDEVYEGRSEWRLLPAFDHPAEAARCLVSGTGLTHMASAANRNAMHEAAAKNAATDSMRMYQWGVEGGRPAEGEIGTQPEWFYKGTGAILRAHGDPLPVPSYGEDGGEEPEIAGAYLIDRDGNPWRAGFCTANEFSDHRMEKRNYLYLAPSKLRPCSIGPELVTGVDFLSISGEVRVDRAGRTLWSSSIATGETHMCHSLTNIEHHHFKYDAHRRPGDVHIHFFGAAAFSFGAGVALEEGDIMHVEWHGFGRPLRNPLAVEREPARLLAVKRLI